MWHRLHYFNKGVEEEQLGVCDSMISARKFPWVHYSLFHYFSSKIITPFLIGLNPPANSS